MLKFEGDDMKIKIIIIMIAALIVVSTADAFVFRGIEYKWGTHRVDVMSYESMMEDSELVEDEPASLVYQFTTKDGPAVAVYSFEGDRLKQAFIYIETKYSLLTNYVVFHQIKKSFEGSIGDPINETTDNCLYQIDDTLVYLWFERDELGQIAINFQPTSSIENANNTEADQDVSSSNYVAFKNSVDTLENVEWGANPETLSDLTFQNHDTTDGVSVYVDKDSNRYLYFKKKLFSVVNFYEDTEATRKKKIDYLDEKFGKGTNKEKYFLKFIVWKTENYSISLVPKPNNPNISVIEFEYTSILREKEEYPKKIQSQQTKVTSEKENEQKKSDGYNFVNVDDLILDIKTLKGRKIKTKAVGTLLRIINDFNIWLYRSENDYTTPINVNANNLPRDQRKYLLKNCEAERCKIMVFGRVDTDIIGSHIIVADKISY
jgi:hypothetical protein